MSLSEFQLIESFFLDQSNANSLVVANGDDAAVFEIGRDMQLVQCVDTLVEGQHFFANTAPEAIGYKALAVNISDLAAMGATPHSFLLALTMPNADSQWLEAFSNGLHRCAKQYGIHLIGGDTTKGPLTISITANGLLPINKVLTRKDAEADNLIFVSGYLGGAAYSTHLHYQNQIPPNACQQQLDYPQARITLGNALLELATACIDISDGLIADLGKLLKASQKGAKINIHTLPIHPALKQHTTWQQAIQFALNGGDDYELCFCAPKDKINDLENLATTLQLPLSCIGQISENKTFTVVDQDQNPVQLTRFGFDHFQPNI